MKSQSKRLAMCVGAILLVLSSSSPAQAQVPPLPPIPDGLVPVVEVLGPVVGAKCADAQAVLVVGGAAVGGPINDALGINILGEDLASVFVLCGMLSGTSTGQYRCLADDVVHKVVETPLTMAAGLPLPIQVDYLAQLLQTTYEIQDLLPNVLLDAGLLDLLTETLSCAPLKGAEDGLLPPPVTLPPAPPTSSPPTTAAPTTTTAAPTTMPPVAPAPTLAVPIVDSVPMDVEVSAPPTTAELPANTELAASIPLAPIWRFQYPIVFLLPVLFLAAVAHLGRSLTRSLEPVD